MYIKGGVAYQRYLAVGFAKALGVDNAAVGLNFYFRVIGEKTLLGEIVGGQLYWLTNLIMYFVPGNARPYANKNGNGCCSSYPCCPPLSKRDYLFRMLQLRCNEVPCGIYVKLVVRLQFRCPFKDEP